MLIRGIAVSILALVGGTSVAHSACVTDAEFKRQKPDLNSYVHEVGRTDGSIVSIYRRQDAEQFLEVIRNGRCIASIKNLNEDQLWQGYQLIPDAWTELGMATEEGLDNEGRSEEEAISTSSPENMFPFLIPERFAAPMLYNGPKGSPDFKGRDKNFADFRTHISESMKRGVTFSGEYAVTQIGCGTNCSIVILSNLRTGQQFHFPRGGEEVGPLSLKYNANSRLMIATWREGDKCVLESFQFSGNALVTLAKPTLGAADLCYDEIDQNIARYKKRVGEGVALSDPSAAKTEQVAPKTVSTNNSTSSRELQNFYGLYIVVRACFESKQGTAIGYINKTQYEAAKEAIKKMESEVLSKAVNLQTESTWSGAQSEMKDTVSLLFSRASGYHTNLKKICDMSFSSLISNSGISSQTQKKDF